jgi:hypothetical protein
MRIALAAALAAVLAAGAAQAFPSGANSIKDWAGVCDNTGACTAMGFTPDDGSTIGYLRLIRQAGPGAAPTVEIVVDPGDTQPAQTWTLLVDGKPAPGIGPLSVPGSDDGARIKLTQAQVDALLAVLKQGTNLDLKSGTTTIAEISLSGSAAILLWIDVYQGRVDGVTALAGKGPKPASEVPPAVAPPLVVPVAAVSQAGLPANAPRALVKGDSDCVFDRSDPAVQPDDTIGRLAKGVVLWGVECQPGAYNEVTQFFLGDEHAAHAHMLTLPEPPGIGEDPEAKGLLINAGYDAPGQTLSSFDKGRGIGDCGASTSWVWDGKAFVLAQQNMMPACRGVVADDWPATYVSRSK